MSTVPPMVVQALLAEAKICAESDWDAVRAHIEDDARYAALKTDGERRRIFESIVSDMRQQAASLRARPDPDSNPNPNPNSHHTDLMLILPLTAKPSPFRDHQRLADCPYPLTQHRASSGDTAFCDALAVALRTSSARIPSAGLRHVLERSPGRCRVGAGG